MKHPVTLITDCRDGDARSRQNTNYVRAGIPLTGFLGISHKLTAAGAIATHIALLEGEPGIVIGNAAPRGDADAPKRSNGSPFGYLEHEGTLIVSTVDCPGLTLLPRLGFGDTVNVIDIPAIAATLFPDNEERQHRAIRTQFRSLHVLPFLVAYLWEHSKIKSTPELISPLQGEFIYFVDAFGNCKTTLTDQSFQGETLVVSNQEIPRYRRLSDVPIGKLGLVTGSSGPFGNEFLEIVLNGKSAAEKLGIKTGDQLYFE